MPTCARGAAARIACTPRPCASSRWCPAARAASGSLRPGAWTPVRYPLVATTCGSFSVAEERHPISEAPGDDRGVVGECDGQGPRRPAPRVFQSLGQVPVIQGHMRGNAVRQQLVDEPIVEVEPRCVDLSGSQWHDARPGDRKAIRVEAEVGKQPDVLAVPVVVIAGDVSRVTSCHSTGLMAELIPDAVPLSVLMGGAFDLVGGGCRPPRESSRELPLHRRTSSL